MKTKHIILTLGLLLVCLVTTAIGKGTSLISGQSLTELGQYSISVSAQDLKVGDEMLTTYELKYGNSDSPILIGVKKTRKCVNFIIHTDNFEIEYVCKNHVFGVKRINQEYQTVPSAVINEKIDNAQFYRQQVISQYPKSEEELLALIACYLPSLIKSEKLADL